MNKTKFIPILAVAALLSACGTSNSKSVKEPKFAKEGSEVEYEPFFIDLTDNAQTLDIMGDKKLASANSTAEVNYLGTTSTKRNNKEVEFESQRYFSSEDIKYDSKSSIVTEDYTEIETQEYKNAAEAKTRKETEHCFISMQQVSYDDKEYFAIVDQGAKVVGLEYELNDNENAEYRADQTMKEFSYFYCGLYEAEEYFMQLYSISDEDLESYKFYKNDKTFTFVHNVDIKGIETKNDEDELIKTTDIKEYGKVQITFNGNYYKLVAYHQASTTVTYAMNCEENGYQYEAGDSVEVTGTMSREYEYVTKDISLKPLSTEGLSFMVY